MLYTKPIWFFLKKNHSFFFYSSYSSTCKNSKNVQISVRSNATAFRLSPANHGSLVLKRKKFSRHFSKNCIYALQQKCHVPKHHLKNVHPSNWWSTKEMSKKNQNPRSFRSVFTSRTVLKWGWSLRRPVSKMATRTPFPVICSRKKRKKKWKKQFPLVILFLLYESTKI